MNNRRKAYLMVSLFILIGLSGCRDKSITTTSDNLKKNSPLGINTISKTLNEFFQNSDEGKRRIFLHFEKVQDIDRQYLVDFNFVSKLHKNEPSNRAMSIVVQLCEKKFTYKDLSKYSLYSQTLPSIKLDKYEHDVVFSFEELKRYQFISENETNQKDLCLYRNEISFGHDGIVIGSEQKEYLISNALVYSADEINTVRVEYESLTQ